MGAFLDYVTPSPNIEDFRGLFNQNAEHPQVLVWHGDMLAMKEAMIACYQEASQLGVLRGEISVEDAVRFLL